MGYVDRHIQNHWLFGMLTNDCSGVHRLVLHKRRRIELGAQYQDIIPIGHFHLRAHGFDDRFSSDCHLMDFCHVAAGSITAHIFGGIIKGSAFIRTFLYLHLLFLLYAYKYGSRLLTYRTLL